MILIYGGKVENFSDKSIMSTEIVIDGQVKDVVVAVDKEYGQFFSPERADYALLGMLAYAMRNGHDIICEAPVTEELLYNISETFIPTLVYSDSRNYPVKIQADIASPLKKVSIDAARGGGWHRTFLRS